MAFVPFKLWEEMKRWKEEQIQKPSLPPDSTVSATASLQRDLSSVMANGGLSEVKNLNYMTRPYTKLKQLIKKL